MWSSSAVLRGMCVLFSRGPVFTCTPRALAVARGSDYEIRNPKLGQKGSCFLLLQLGVNCTRIRKRALLRPSTRLLVCQIGCALQSFREKMSPYLSQLALRRSRSVEKYCFFLIVVREKHRSG